MKPGAFLHSKMLVLFRPKDDEPLAEKDPKVVKEGASRFGRPLLISLCLAVIMVSAMIGLTVLALDVWQPTGAASAVGDVIPPELYLCAPTPYRSADKSSPNSAVNKKLPVVEDDVNDLKQKPLTRYRRAESPQIRRILRPLSLPPHFGGVFEQAPPLYHDSGARCQWVELDGKKIAGLDEVSYDFQLLELINCSDMNECKAICLRMYHADDPNLCNYFTWNRQKQVALFYYIDPLVNWNITNDDRQRGFFWKCNSIPCDWFWRRHQKLKIIDLKNPDSHLISQTFCKDFGSCQRQCETHPTCNYVITPTNRSIGGPSFLYTLPNEMFRESNFSIDEIHDSFEMFCKPPDEATQAPQGPAIAIEIPASQLIPAAPPVAAVAPLIPGQLASTLAPLINPAQQPTPGGSGINPVPQPTPGSVGINPVPQPTPGPILNLSLPSASSPKPLPPAPPVSLNLPEDKQPAQPSSTLAPNPPSIAPNNQSQIAQSNNSAIKNRLKRSNNKKSGATLERCFVSETEIDCPLITTEVTDQNKAKCIRIKLDEISSNNNDMNVKLFMKVAKSDWTANYFWFSLLQPENRYFQQDVYLRHTEANEMQLAARQFDDVSMDPVQSMNKRKLCKAQCLNTVATKKCQCTTMKQYSSITGLKMCSNEIMYDCVYYKGATMETNQCLKDCDPGMSVDYQYSVSVKSTLVDLLSADSDNNNLLLDIKLKYKNSQYKAYNVFCVSIVLAVIGLLCIVLFACCCSKAIRHTS